jgi:hypothetical protein
MHILHVRKWARYKQGARAGDAHIILRVHVGALRQQRPNHLQVAAQRGVVEWRPSVLRLKRASRSAPPSAPTHARTPTRTHALSLTLPIAHTLTCTLFDKRYKHTQTYNDTLTHARTHRIHAVAGWGRHRYLTLAAATYCGPCLAAGQRLTDPDAYSLWRIFAMALKPCSRSAVVRDSNRGIHAGTSPRGSHAHSTCAQVSEIQTGRTRAMLTFAVASTSAPFTSSAPTTSKWPPKEALWSGVRPSCGAGEHRGQRLLPRTHMLHDRTNACTFPHASDRTYTHMHAL